MPPAALIPLSRDLAKPLYPLIDRRLYLLGRTDPSRLILPAMLGQHPMLAEERDLTVETRLRHFMGLRADLLAEISKGMERPIDADMATIYAAMLVVVMEGQALKHLQGPVFQSGFYGTPDPADPLGVSIYFEASQMSPLVGDFLEVSLLPHKDIDCIELAGIKKYSEKLRGPSRYLIARVIRSGAIYFGTHHCGSHDLDGTERTGMWPDLEAAFRLTLWLEMINMGNTPARLKLG